MCSIALGAFRRRSCECRSAIRFLVANVFVLAQHLFVLSPGLRANKPLTLSSQSSGTESGRIAHKRNDTEGEMRQVFAKVSPRSIEAKCNRKTMVPPINFQPCICLMKTSAKSSHLHLSPLGSTEPTAAESKGIKIFNSGDKTVEKFSVLEYCGRRRSPCAIVWQTKEAAGTEDGKLGQ